MALLMMRKKKLHLFLLSIIIFLIIIIVLEKRERYKSYHDNACPKVNISFHKFIFNFSQTIPSPTVNLGSESSNKSKQSNVTITSLNILNHTKKANNFEKATMDIYGKNIIIFIFGREDYVSRAILDDRMWEGEWVHQLVYFLRQFKFGVKFLDIGCNIGVYSLAVASFGYEVIAVDANKNNTDRLMQAMIENHLEDKIMIILNAISNIRTNFSMTTVITNVGSQQIVKDDTAEYQVRSILLNDLVLVTKPEESIIIKIDIEGSEIDLFKEALDLFVKREVVAVFMEWMIVKHMPNCQIIVTFFRTANYKPYENFVTEKGLDITNYQSWPDEMVWKKVIETSEPKMST